MVNKNEVTPTSVNKLSKILKAIEIAGNKLPHPVMLFFYGIILLVVLSTIFSLLGVTVEDPRPEGTKGRAEDGLIHIKNLLGAEGIRYMFTTLISNFVSFAPFGTVLISFIGIGVAERSGLIETALKSLVRVTPKRIITVMVVFSGVMSNTASELGYLVLIPLGAIVFYGFGRHPLAGLGAAFAGVSGGYSANLLLGSVDPLLSGLSQEAAKFLDLSYTVGAEANWYFMAASVFLVVVIGTVITDKVVEPSLGKFDPKNSSNPNETIRTFGALTVDEKRGLKAAGIFSLLFALVLYASVWPGSGLMLNQTTMSMSGSPFFQSIVAFIFIYFLLIGMIYGFISKTFKTSTDVIDAMQGAVVSLSIYIILVFFMAQFISYFGYTNLAVLIAVGLADFVKHLGLNQSIFMVSFIFIVGFINLFMGSASAKWALLAPIFVPMFMLLGFSPELTQAAYRVGDSATNIISPLNSYLALILLMGAKYSKNFGMGSLISLMAPYSVVFLVVWSIFFYFWVFVFGLPVGPGPNYYPA